jgi:hypothetical protein
VAGVTLPCYAREMRLGCQTTRRNVKLCLSHRKRRTVRPGALGGQVQNGSPLLKSIQFFHSCIENLRGNSALVGEATFYSMESGC